LRRDGISILALAYKISGPAEEKVVRQPTRMTAKALVPKRESLPRRAGSL